MGLCKYVIILNCIVLLFYACIAVNPVIKGYLMINITGYNLGNSRSDIIYISIKAINCSTIIHVSSSQLICITTAFHSNEVIVSNDITLVTVSGIMQGIYLQPAVLLAAKTYRPIISNINIKHL